MSVRKYFIKQIALSILLCIALASPAIAQITKSSTLPDLYDTKVITKTYNAPALYLSQGTWLIQDTIKVRELTIRERAILKAPEGKYLTLTLNGIGKEIKPGAYKGDVVLSVTDNYFIVSQGMTTSRNFHSAFVIKDGKVLSKNSTPALLYRGKVTDTKAEGIYIGNEAESYNGIIIDGNSEYTINNAQFDLDGFSDNDFAGVGAAVANYGNAKVTINDSEFNINGVTRCAFHAGGHSVTTLNNCKLFVHAPVSDWVGSDQEQFTWQIGFRGNGRVTQHADYSTTYFNNCEIRGNGTWCLLSLDNNKQVKVVVKDSSLKLSGPRSRGYGVFNFGNNDITYDHSTFDINGYPLIQMGTKGKASIINGTVLKGRLYGIFSCSDNNSVVTIKDSTIDTDKANLVIRGSAMTFNIDNTVMKAGNGVIVQLHDDEEDGMNKIDYKIPVGVVDKPMPGRDLTAASPSEDVKINISNSNIKGNFFNSTTNIHAEKNSATGSLGPFHDNVLGTGASQEQQKALGGGMDMAAMMAAAGTPDPTLAKDLQGPKNLALNLTNVTVEGIISSATQAYREGLTVITSEIREELSNITQTPAEAVNNGVIVSLDKGSVWTVTGTSYINSLTIAQGAQVKAPAGKSLTMTVDGATKTIGAGTYKGKIKIAVN